MNIIDVLFPQGYKCILCGSECEEGRGICDSCVRTLPILRGNLCTKCGGKVRAGELVCMDCKANLDSGFERNTCVFEYVGDIKSKILAFKNGGQKFLGKTFSKILLSKYNELGLKVDVVIPVPIHPARRKDRGYNQCEILCEDIDKSFHNVNKDILMRVVDTPHQTGLSRINRKQNLKGAFAVSDKSKVKDKVILLVDDIYTTGSTLSACAETLMNAKAKKVYALCLARGDNDYTLVI